MAIITRTLKNFCIRVIFYHTKLFPKEASAKKDRYLLKEIKILYHYFPPKNKQYIYCRKIRFQNFKQKIKNECINRLQWICRFNFKKKYRNWHLYNSKNISKIRYKDYSEIICAGLPAAKWKANKFPKKDENNLNKLIRNIALVNCKLFILISTIDIYKKNETYGINRKKLELFVKKKNLLIISFLDYQQFLEKV